MGQATQYWVVGGEFSGTDFHTLHAEQASAHGPYRDYAAAKRVWAELSVASRPLAHVRYVITAANTGLNG